VAERSSAVARFGLRLLAAAALISFASGFSRQSEPPAIVNPMVADGDRILLPAWRAPKPQLAAGEQRHVISVLKVAGPMTYGEFVWADKGVPYGEIWVRVDLHSQIISVFRGGHEIGTAPILYGADEKPTPIGKFPILEKRKDHVSNLYGAPMPYTLRLTNDGIAIHGSDVRIGAATHGCVGVPLAFAEKLFAQARVGNEVIVVRGGKPALPLQDQAGGALSRT
jgi:hypothetical protein